MKPASLSPVLSSTDVLALLLNSLQLITPQYLPPGFRFFSMSNILWRLECVMSAAHVHNACFLCRHELSMYIKVLTWTDLLQGKRKDCATGYVHKAVGAVLCREARGVAASISY